MANDHRPTSQYTILSLLLCVMAVCRSIWCFLRLARVLAVLASICCCWPLVCPSEWRAAIAQAIFSGDLLRRDKCVYASVFVFTVVRLWLVVDALVSTQSAVELHLYSGRTAISAVYDDDGPRSKEMLLSERVIHLVDCVLGLMMMS